MSQHIYTPLKKCFRLSYPHLCVLKKSKGGSTMPPRRHGEGGLKPFGLWPKDLIRNLCIFFLETRAKMARAVFSATRHFCVPLAGEGVRGCG